nr:MAG TPA_asm: hypothetical protein [Caudoviricetes sp.]
MLAGKYARFLLYLQYLIKISVALVRSLITLQVMGISFFGRNSTNILQK